MLLPCCHLLKSNCTDSSAVLSWAQKPHADWRSAGWNDWAEVHWGFPTHKDASRISASHLLCRCLDQPWPSKCFKFCRTKETWLHLWSILFILTKVTLHSYRFPWNWVLKKGRMLPITQQVCTRCCSTSKNKLRQEIVPFLELLISLSIFTIFKHLEQQRF